MRVGSVVYNTEYIAGSTHGYQPGNLFVVASQHENGGLYTYALEPTGVLFGTKIELDVNTFHRADKDLEKTVQDGYELKDKVENFGKSLPNPQKANIDALAAEIHAGLSDLVGGEDESGLEEEEDDEDEEGTEDEDGKF